MTWCLACNDLATFKIDAGTGPGTSKQSGCMVDHPKKVVELDDEVVRSWLQRLVGELRRTNRLILSR